MKTMKRIVCMLLVVAMLAAIPVTASAAAPGHTHKLEKTTQARDCNTEGYTRVTCSLCDLEYFENKMPSYHVYYDNVKAVKNSDGTTSYYCAKCYSDSPYELFATSDPDCNHKYKEANVWPATCESKELKHFECTEGCGYIKASAGQGQLGHHWVEIEADHVDPTVTSEGSAHYECDRDGCGNEFTCALPKLAAINRKATTTTTYTEVYKGSSAAKTLVGYLPEGTNVMIYAHTDTSVTPEMYQIDKTNNYWILADKTTDLVDPNADRLENCGNHKYKFLYQAAATCEEKGYSTQKCENCDYYKFSTTPALGHDWDDGVRVEPTTTTKGSITYTCKRASCTETKEVELDEKLETYKTATTDNDETAVYNGTSDAKTLVGYLPKGVKVFLYGSANTKMYKIDATNNYWVSEDDLTDIAASDGSAAKNCGSHEYKPLYLKPADCENKGYTTKKCVKCEFYSFSTSKALGHVWDEGRILSNGTIDEEPTPTAEGLRRFYCVRTDENGVYVHSEEAGSKTAKLTEYTDLLDAIVTDELAKYDYIKTEKVAKIKAPYKVMVVKEDAFEDEVYDVANKKQPVVYIYNGSGVNKKLVGFAPVGTRFNVYAQTFDGSWLCIDNSTAAGYWIKGSVAEESDDQTQSCKHTTSKTVMKWAATCDRAEFITNYCGQCGRITTSIGAAALGHSYSAWKTVGDTEDKYNPEDAEHKAGEWEYRRCLRKVYDDLYGWVECGEIELREIPEMDKKDILASGYVSGGEVIRVYDGFNAGQTHIGYATKGVSVNVYAYSPDSKWCDIAAPGEGPWWVRRSDLTLGSISNNASVYAGASKYGVLSSGVSVKVYSGPTMDSTVLSSLPKGSKIAVFGEPEDGFVKISAKEDKWVKYDLIQDDMLPVWVTQNLDENGAVVEYKLPEKVIAKGRVTSDGLNIRKSASTLSELVNGLNKDDEINIFEIVSVKGVEWGRVKGRMETGDTLDMVDWTKDIKLEDYNDANEGKCEIVSAWVCMTYVAVEEDLGTSETPAATDYRTGTVATGGIALNVRKKADVYSDKIGSLTEGTSVTIYETKNASNGVAWGRISQNSLDGWVCMQYVVLDASASTSTGVAASANAAVANCATGVNVRTKADISGTQIAKIPVGTRIAVTKTSKGWGYVDSVKGWVYLEYVAFDAGALEALQNATTSTTAPSDEVAVTKYTAIELPAIMADDADLCTTPGVASTAKLGLMKDAEITVKNMTLKDDHMYVQTTVGSITGWLRLDDVSIGTVSGTVKSAGTKVYEKDNVDSKIVETLGAGSSVTIVPKGYTTDGIYVWGKLSDNRFIQLHNVTLDKFTHAEPIVLTYTVSPAITGIVVKDSTPVLTKPGSTTTLVELKKNTTVSISTWANEGDKCYGKVTTGNFIGWIDMDDIEQEAVQGVASAETVNLYDDMGGTSDKRLVLRTGDKVTITDRILFNDTPWGRMVANKDTEKRELWGNLTGITVDGQVTTPVENTTPATPSVTPTTPASVTIGVVVGADTVNVRSDAHVSSALVATVKKGEQVRVSEQKISDGANWGKIDQGWIAMQYVSLSAATQATNATTNVATGTTIMTSVPAGAIAVGFTNTENLAVRANPGVAQAQVGTLPMGSGVVISQTQAANGLYWGKTDAGWICMSYVTCTAVGTAGSGTAGTIARCFSTVNVRATAGTNSAITAKIMVSSPVQILETTTYSGELWGRTNLGWVAMQYVA